MLLPLLTGLAMQTEPPGLILPPRRTIIAPSSLVMPTEAERQHFEPCVLGMFPFPSLLLKGAAAGVITQVYNVGAGAGSTGWNGFTARQTIAASEFTDVIGTKVRFRLTSTIGTAIVFDKMYFGEKGTATGEFASAPTAITWGGSASHTVPANTTEDSDQVSFAFDGTKAYVISWHFSGTTSFTGSNTAANSSIIYKAAVDDAASLGAPSGYTTATVHALCLHIDALV